MIAARIYLLVCVVLWGWTFVFAKVALAYVTPAELLGLRLLTGLPVMLIVILIKRLKLKFNLRQWRRVMIGSAVLTVHFLIQITGIKYTSATNTGWIISVTPLALALLSYLILKERISTRTLLGLVVATAGIVLLVSKGELAGLGWLKSVGDWLVLVSAHTWAIYTIVTRDLSREGRPLTVTFAMLLPSLALMLVYMLLTSDWSEFAALPAEPVLAIVYLGVLGMGVAHWFWQEGVARLGAARAGMFLYIEPLATTGLAVPYLHESFGLLTAFGALLVLGGVYLSERPGRTKN
jgi:drug/metabolite transporter (DMT)-like permease